MARMEWRGTKREGASSPVIGYSIIWNIWRGVLSGLGLAAVSSASVQCRVCFIAPYCSILVKG